MKDAIVHCIVLIYTIVLHFHVQDPLKISEERIHLTAYKAPTGEAV